MKLTFHFLFHSANVSKMRRFLTSLLSVNWEGRSLYRQVIGPIAWQIHLMWCVHRMHDGIGAKLVDRLGHTVSTVMALSAIVVLSAIGLRDKCDCRHPTWRQNGKVLAWTALSIASESGAIERTSTVRNFHFVTRINPISRFQSRSLTNRSGYKLMNSFQIMELLSQFLLYSANVSKMRKFVTSLLRSIEGDTSTFRNWPLRAIRYFTCDITILSSNYTLNIFSASRNDLR
jgi:hypothetical protein